MRINDASHFAWQAQYSVKLKCHFSWQAQYLVKFGMIAGARNVVFFNTKCHGSSAFGEGARQVIKELSRKHCMHLRAAM